jgi:hypothetical protein
MALLLPYRHLWADCLEKMWEPRRLTTLWASTACYRDSFTYAALINASVLVKISRIKVPFSSLGGHNERNLLCLVLMYSYFYTCYFPEGKGATTWSWSLTSIWYWSEDCVSLYLHSLIYLHDARHNYEHGVYEVKLNVLNEFYVADCKNNFKRPRPSSFGDDSCDRHTSPLFLHFLNFEHRSKELVRT